MPAALFSIFVSSPNFCDRLSPSDGIENGSQCFSFSFKIFPHRRRWVTVNRDMTSWISFTSKNFQRLQMGLCRSHRPLLKDVFLDCLVNLPDSYSATRRIESKSFNAITLSSTCCYKCKSKGNLVKILSKPLKPSYAELLKDLAKKKPSSKKSFNWPKKKTGFFTVGKLAENELSFFSPGNHPRKSLFFFLPVSL